MGSGGGRKEEAWKRKRACEMLLYIPCTLLPPWVPDRGQSPLHPMSHTVSALPHHHIKPLPHYPINTSLHYPITPLPHHYMTIHPMHWRLHWIIVIILETIETIYFLG